MQKGALVRDFNRIIQRKNKKKIEKGKCEIFFDSEKYEIFADATGLTNSGDSLPSEISVPTSSCVTNSSDSLLSEISVETSSSEQHDNVISIEATTSQNVGESKSAKNVQSKKRSHNENCQVICICCLQKTKENVHVINTI